jgi:hypothetical protein
LLSSDVQCSLKEGVQKPVYPRAESPSPCLKSRNKISAIILSNLRNQEDVERVSQNSLIFFLTNQPFGLLLF